MKKKILQGIGVSSGKVTGKVKLVFGLADKENFEIGNILVTSITDPTMVTMMTKASAIVCDIGGITSHPAIVSRELGIPCVVNTKEATKKLKNGMLVEVDGSTGEVFLLSGDKNNKNIINRKYPDWIDDFAIGAYSLIGGNVLEAFRPIDFYHFNPLWYDLFLQKIKLAIEKLNNQNFSRQEMYNLLPDVSMIRSVLIRIIPAIPHLSKENYGDYLEVIEFLIEALQHKMQEDIFAIEKNVIHSEEDIKEIILKNKFYKVDKKLAKRVGAMNVAAGHLINGLYNDVNTDYGWEAFGPYDVSKYFGEDHEMLIRKFIDLKPNLLWKNLPDKGVSEVEIVTIYEKLGASIHFVGCHTKYKGDPVESMRWACVSVKGDKDVDHFNYLVETAEKHYEHIKSLDIEKLKLKSQEQDLYCLRDFFIGAVMDWKPDKEMKRRVCNKDLCKGLFSHGKLFNFEEFCEEFGINYLKRAYIKRG